ncbi:MAG: hypothetical protein HY600_03020 [Candidatus Omnitrophica bacterium]|nr:hypothetical protein [Candidatus Omnitrophota bacterium]
MKPWHAVGLVVGIVFTAGPRADAAMLTLPEDPKGGSRLDVGVDYENILHRELDGLGASDNDVKRFDAAYLRVQYAVHAMLNGYARIGSGRVTHRIEDTFVNGIGYRDLTFESGRALAWGGGVTGGIGLPWHFKGGYDLNYHTLTADVQDVTHANDDAVDPLARFNRDGSNISGELRWREVQAAAWVARPIELDHAKLIPYVGAKWSRLTLDDNDVRYNVTDAGTTQTITFDGSSKNVTRWGAVLGVRIVYDQRLVIVIEGHEIDDEAAIGSVSWRF